MTEYLYDAIVAVSGEDITVNAVITDDMGQAIKTGCSMVLCSDNDELIEVEGTYVLEDEAWEFTIPADTTTGLSGRYWYYMRHNESNLCFKQPIYLKK